MSSTSTRRFTSLVGWSVLGLAAVALVGGGFKPALIQEPAPTPPPAPAAVRPADLPEAGEIVDRHIKALGGRDAIMKQTSRSMTGTFERSGEKVGLTIHAAAPAKMLMIMNLPEVGEVRQGFDGEVVWIMEPHRPPVATREPEIVTQMTVQADFHSDLRLKDRYDSLETVDKRSFAGKECYVVKAVAKVEDEEETTLHFFAADSGLLQGTEIEADLGMGPMTAQTIHEEYREYDGVKYPVRTVMSVGPLSQVTVFEEIKINDVDESVFALPAEVVAALEAAEGEEAPAPIDP